MARLPGLLSESGRKLVPAAGVRLGPPVARPGKIICLGKITPAMPGNSTPGCRQSPILFDKAATAVTGPHDRLPAASAAVVDLEAELALVIGPAGWRRTARWNMSPATWF